MIYVLRSSCRAMFTSDLKEGSESSIELHNVDTEGISNLINFMYTGKIEITNNNVQSVFTAASILEMLSVCELSANHMIDELDLSNCLPVYQFARFHSNSKLADASASFCVEHFNELCENMDLLSLSADDLELLIADDNLNVKYESMVYDCVCDWLANNPDHTPEQSLQLFKHVRLSLVEPRFFEEFVLSNTLLMGHDACRKLICTARDFHSIYDDPSSSYDAISAQLGMFDPAAVDVGSGEGYHVPRKRDPAADRPRLGMYAAKMLVFVGGSVSKDTRALTAFDPHTRKNYWAIPLHISFDFKYRIDYHRVVICQGNLYLVGGIFYEDHHFDNVALALSEVKVYEPFNKSWRSCAEMQVPRCAHTVESVGDCIYAVGGKSKFAENSEALSWVERYQPQTDSWRYVSSMPFGLFHHGSVVYEERIYVMGGFVTDGNTSNRFLQYTPETDIWITLEQNLRIKRAQFGVSMVNNKIYVIGGMTDANTRLASMEVYNMNRGRWVFGVDFPEDRTLLRAVTFDDCLYVCGGVRTLISRRNGTPREIETKDLWKYDPMTGFWSKHAKLVQYANIHACVVTEINVKRLFESEFVSSA